MQDPSTGEVWMPLLTITHPSLQQPLYLANNNENIVSRGATFLGCPFQVNLPKEDGDQPGTATVSIDNVDRRIVDAVRTLPIGQPLSINIEIILASSPDYVEVTFPSLVMRNVTYDAEKVTGTLSWEDILTEPAALTITPARFPGSF